MYESYANSLWISQLIESSSILRYKTGKGLDVGFLPDSSENIVLILNGRAETTRKTVLQWLDELSNFPSLQVWPIVLTPSSPFSLSLHLLLSIPFLYLHLPLSIPSTQPSSSLSPLYSPPLPPYLPPFLTPSFHLSPSVIPFCTRCPSVPQTVLSQFHMI